MLTLRSLLGSADNPEGTRCAGCAVPTAPHPKALFSRRALGYFCDFSMMCMCLCMCRSTWYNGRDSSQAEEFACLQKPKISCVSNIWCHARA